MSWEYNSRTGDFDGGGGDGPGCFTIAAIVFGAIALLSLIMSFFF